MNGAPLLLLPVSVADSDRPEVAVVVVLVVVKDVVVVELLSEDFRPSIAH